MPAFETLTNWIIIAGAALLYSVLDVGGWLPSDRTHADVGAAPLGGTGRGRR